MDLNLEGKSALVTGGSRGIGRAIAKSLKEEGCKVAICARNIADLETTARELGCSYITADCTKEGDIRRVISNYPSSDILINNIGGGGSWGSEDYEKFGEWREVYDKNAGAAVSFTMGYLPHMRENNWGRVVTIASIFGKEGGGRPWFNMANAAEISLMKCLALKRYEGVTFNSVSPGHIEVGKGHESEVRGEPEDVANLVAFLCSERAKHINGANIVVDGGETSSF